MRERLVSCLVPTEERAQRERGRHSKIHATSMPSLPLSSATHPSTFAPSLRLTAPWPSARKRSLCWRAAVSDWTKQVRAADVYEAERSGSRVKVELVKEAEAEEVRWRRWNEPDDSETRSASREGRCCRPASVVAVSPDHEAAASRMTGRTAAGSPARRADPLLAADRVELDLALAHDLRVGDLHEVHRPELRVRELDLRARTFVRISTLRTRTRARESKRTHLVRHRHPLELRRRPPVRLSKH